MIKHLDSIGNAAGDTAVFTITATNTGNVVLRTVAVADTMSRLDGFVLASPATVFQSNSAGSPEGTLAPAEVASWTVQYVLTQEDIDAGGISNQAVVSAKTPVGATISDVSDDNGSGDSDPTLAPIGAIPGMAVVKSVNTPRILFPTVEQATFTITVRNTGNITETGLGLVDDLAAFLAPATLDPDYPVTVGVTGFGAGTANPAYDGTAVTQVLAAMPRCNRGKPGRCRSRWLIPLPWAHRAARISPAPPPEKSPRLRRRTRSL